MTAGTTGAGTAMVAPSSTSQHRSFSQNNGRVTSTSTSKSKSNTTSNRRRVGVQSRSKDDVIERFFQWGETNFCSPKIHGLKEKKKNSNNNNNSSMDTTTTTDDDDDDEPDVLDYLFENVESFTCAEDLPFDPTSSAPQLLVLEPPPALQRDNSLCNSLIEVPVGSNTGAPTQQQPTQRQQNVAGVVAGVSGSDLLDYCFEHVESLVCTEGNEAFVLSESPMSPLVALDQLVATATATATATSDQAALAGSSSGGDDEAAGSGGRNNKKKKNNNRKQKKRAKAAIETQLNAMTTEEDEEAEEEKQKEKQNKINKQRSWLFGGVGGASGKKLFKKKIADDATPMNDDSKMMRMNIPSEIISTSSKETSTASASAKAKAVPAVPITPSSSSSSPRPEQDDNMEEEIQLYYRPKAKEIINNTNNDKYLVKLY